MFNTGFRGKRAGDGTGIINPQEQFVQNKYPVPTITSWSISGTDDTALDPAGGQTVLVNGGGFVAGCAVTVNGVTITPVTVISPNQISFTSTALAGGSYTLIVYNSEGGGAILVPGLVYSSVPTYTTGAGSIGSGYETTAISTSVVATSDSSLTYAVTSGALPSGASMTSGGVITGTYPLLSSGSSETFYFDITATDAESQDVTRSFSLTTNIDVVTWVTPSSGATITLDGTAYSQALSATDAAGYSVSYTANALPTGLTLSSGTISGTPTSEETVSTLLTATAATTNRTGTNTITWVVSLGDIFWKNVTLLLSGTTPTTSFINDASLNNRQLTIAGDTKPTKFSPYSDGYYSYNFDGASYALGSTPTNNANFGVTIGTQDFCLEGWGCWTSFNFGTYGAPIISLLGQTAGELMIRATKTSGNTTSANFFSILGASTYIPSSMYTSGVSVGTLYLNKWHHLAVQRISGTWYFYVDGVMLNSTSAGNASLTLAFTKFYIGSDAASGGGYMAGNVSNVRLSVGTVPYASGGFTVPTSPLPYLPTTKFLSAQSNKLVDNGPINSTFTTGGTGVKVALLSPFNQPTTGRVPTLFSTHFDGTSGYISTTHNSQLSMDSGNFSAECWCYRTCSVSGESATLVNKSGTGYVTVPHWIFGSTNGYWSYGVGSSGNTGTTLFSIQTSTAVVPDTWHHVAMIKTGTTYSMFVNGTRIHTTTNATVPLDNNPLGLSIGFQFAQTSICYWWGQIADVRINKGTLPTGYDATQTTIPVPTQKLTAVTGTVLLTCQDSTLRDNSTNNFTISSVSPAKPFPVSPFGQTYTSTDVTNLGSAYFDGTGDYLSIPHSKSLYLESGDFTIEFWYNSTIAFNTGYGPCIGFGYKNTPTGGWVIYRNTVVNTNSITLRVAGQGGAGWVDFSTTSTVEKDTWNHWAVVRSGTSLRWYKNGVLDASTTNSVNITDTDTTTLGYVGFAQQWSYHAQGYLSNVRVVKGTALYSANFLPPPTPLTPVTNTQLLTCQYNGGANNNGIIDQSGYNNYFTRYGNITQGTFSPFSQNGWSNYFNGSTYFYGPAGITTTTGMGTGFSGNIITIETWIYPTTLSGSNTYTAFIGAYAAVGANGRYWFGFSSTGNLTFTYTTGTGSEDNIIASGNGIIVNQWHHVAVTIDATVNTNTTVNLFLNGTRIVNATSKNFSTQTTYYDRPYIGGNYSQYVNNFTGYLSNFRISKNVAVYTGSYTPSTVPLSATTNTVLLTYQNNQIIDNSINQYVFTLPSGTTSIQAFSPFGGVTNLPTSYSAYFGTTTMGVQTPASSLTNIIGTSTLTSSSTFTIEAWINQQSRHSGGASAIGFVAGSLNVTGGNADWGFGPKSDGKLTVWWWNGSAVVQAISTNVIPLNTWTHVATTVSNGAIKIFINGVEETLTGTTTVTTVSSSLSYFTVGGYTYAGTTWQGYNGYISNLRVVKAALYTTGFTPSTVPLTAIENTSLLLFQSPTIIDNSSNSYVLTVTNVVLPKLQNPFGMTTSTNVSYSPSLHGSSLFMDGTGDYLTAPNTKSFDLNSGNWCIECWFYQLAPKQVQLFSVSAALWRLAVDTSGGAGFTFNTSSTTSYPAGSFPAGQWNHIAATFELGATTQQKSFANGKYVAGGALYPNADTTSLFYIGNNKDAAGAWDFNGYMTDVKITRGDPVYRASFVPSFTPAVVTNTTTLLVNGSSGGILDYHSSNDLETVGNTQLAPENPYSGTYYSNYFTGSSSYLTVASNAGLALSADYTIECWVYFTALGQQGIYSSIDNSGDTWQGPHLEMYTNYAPRLLCYSAGGSALVDLVHQTTMTTGRWYHIAAVRISNVTYLYLDGVRSSTSSSDSTSYVQSGATIGQSYPGSSQNFFGYISNMRVIKGTGLYSGSTFTVPTSPLTAVSGTSLLTCQSNKFIDNSTNALVITASTTASVKSMNPFQNNTGKSLYFDGSGDYIANNTGAVNLNEPTFKFEKDFTVETWIYPTSTNIVIFVLGNENTNRFIFYLSSGNQLAYDIYLVGTTTFTPTIQQNCWTHVALTRSGSTITCYINGVSVGTGTSSSTLGNGPLSIGTNGSRNGAYWAGYISDLRITKGVARTITVPTTPYKAK